VPCPGEGGPAVPAHDGGRVLARALDIEPPPSAPRLVPHRTLRSADCLTVARQFFTASPETLPVAQGAEHTSLAETRCPVTGKWETVGSLDPLHAVPLATAREYNSDEISPLCRSARCRGHGAGTPGHRRPGGSPVASCGRATALARLGALMMSPPTRRYGRRTCSHRCSS
jgi:hypothetical protein